MSTIVKRALVRTCVVFTVAMALWCAAGLIFAGPVEGIVVTLSMLGAALAMCALQALWFTEAVLTRPSYPARIAGFALTALPALALCAAPRRMVSPRKRRRLGQLRRHLPGSNGPHHRRLHPVLPPHRRQLRRRPRRYRESRKD